MKKPWSRGRDSDSCIDPDPGVRYGFDIKAI